MRHNRVLGLAIASALAIGANSSFGGELKIEHVYKDAASVCHKVTGAAVLASEIFLSGDQTIFPPFTCPPTDDLDNGGANGPAVPPGSYDDGYFYGTYKFTQDTREGQPFSVQFTLDNGAQFGKDISLGAGVDFVAHPSGSHSGVLKTSGGMKGDTEVTFYISPRDKFSNKDLDTLLLRFNLQNLTVLKSAGQEIKLGAKVYQGTTEFDGSTSPITVATSTQATKTNIDATTGSAQIDVAQGSLQLVGTSPAFIDQSTVKLGSVSISKNSSTSQVLDQAAQPWNFGSNALGTLTIVNLPISASLTLPGAIFLDIGTNNNVYDEGTDILANIDPNRPNVATWTLDGDQLKNFFYSSDGSKKVYIVLKVDGTTVIDEQSEPPTATFSVTYTGGSPQTVNRDLIYIKRNGTVCSIYNIPSPSTIDGAHIRIINTSGGEITVRGSLRDSMGMYIFRDQELSDSPLAANATLYLSGDDLWCNYPYTSAWTTAYGSDCKTFRNQRGTLTINSDAKSMEIYGLLRNRGGGPLTNMSVGATGNGCD